MKLHEAQNMVEQEYKCLPTEEAYQFVRGIIWGTSFRLKPEYRQPLYRYNEKVHDKYKEAKQDEAKDNRE